MTDNEIRRIVLRKFYDLRGDIHPCRLGADELGNISTEDYNRVGKQLGDQGLIEWHTSLSNDGQGRITASGVDAIERGGSSSAG